MKNSRLLFVALAGICFVSCATNFNNRITVGKEDFAAQSNAEVQIPFYVVNEHIFSDWYIKGKKLSLMWDTGCTYNILDISTARKLTGEAMPSLPNGQYYNYREHVVFNQQIYFNGYFQIMDLKALKEVIPGLDGIIGGDLLKNYTVTMDMDKSIITLSNKRLEKADFNFTLEGFVPQTPIEMNGANKLAMIDTGSNSFVAINANNSDITVKRSYVGLGEATAFGFKSSNAGFVTKAILFNTYTINDFIVWDSVALSDKTDALVGIGFFNHGILILDYPGLKGSWLRSSDDYPRLEKKLNPIGCRYIEGKGVVVCNYLVGSIQIRDIKIGDVVVSVNGKKIATKDDYVTAVRNVDSYQIVLTDGVKIKTVNIVKENFQ